MEIDKMRDDKGQLPVYAWPGGYPIYYMAAEDSNVWCPACANVADPSVIAAAGINWEDASLYCDQCSKRIESAYEDK